MNQKRVVDLPAQKLARFWNDVIGEHFPMSAALWEQNTLRDGNTLKDVSIALIEGGQIQAVIVVKKFSEATDALMTTNIGWVQCLLVAKNARGRGLGTQLLNAAQRQLKEEGVVELRLGRDPWHYFPGVPVQDEQTAAWFERRGYRRESIETDLRRTANAQSPYLLDNHPTCFRLLKQSDVPQLLAFLKCHFPGRWHYEALHYAAAGGTGREFIGIFLGGEMRGFCRINDRQSLLIAQNVYWSELLTGPVGGIGPLGIDRSLRGMHFGSDIVKAAANELTGRGAEQLIIDWTQLTEFYGKLGFSVWKQYTTMAKIIG